MKHIYQKTRYHMELICYPLNEKIKGTFYHLIIPAYGKKDLMRAYRRFVIRSTETWGYGTQVKLIDISHSPTISRHYHGEKYNGRVKVKVISKPTREDYLNRPSMKITDFF